MYFWWASPCHSRRTNSPHHYRPPPFYSAERPYLSHRPVRIKKIGFLFGAQFLGPHFWFLFFES